MRKCLLLVKIQLMGFMGVNRILKGKGRASKHRIALIALLGILIGAFIGFYSALTAYGLAYAGLANVIPIVALMFCALSGVVMTFTKASGLLFTFGDFDFIMSLPVSSRAVIASRMIALYGMNFAVTVCAALPAMVVYALWTSPGAVFYVVTALSLFVAPLLPLTVSAVLSAVIAATASRMRHKSIVIVLLSVVLVVASIVLPLMLPQTENELYGLSESVRSSVNRYYPPAALFERAVLEGDLAAFAAFSVINIIPAAAFALLLGRYFVGINTALLARRARGGFAMGRLAGASPFKALYKREFKRLLASPIYMLNMCIGAVLLILMSVAACFGLDFIFSGGSELTELNSLFSATGPLTLAFFSSLSSTTCVSVSLEGKQRWIIASLPVDKSLIYHVKMAVNLTILLPAVFISAPLFAYALGVSFIDGVFMFIVPLAFSFLTAVLGLFVNLKLPKYDWSTEHQVVKQSAAPMVTIFTNMAFIGALYVLILTIPGIAVIINITAAVAAFTAAAILYTVLKRTPLAFY